MAQGFSVFRNMRAIPLILAACTFFLAACSNLANRRALYEPQPVDGPYTRMIRSGSWKLDQPTTTGGLTPETRAGGDGKMVVDFR